MHRSILVLVWVLFLAISGTDALLADDHASTVDVDATLPPLPFSRANMAVPGFSPAQRDASELSVIGAERATEDPLAALAPVRGRMAAPDPETSPAVQAARAAGEKWIQVDLSEQMVYAYEGEALIKSFLVSTGLPGTPTVTGEFRIWVRTPVQTMSGGSRAAGNYYSLPNVQWVQYFYGDYGFHGTYWHNNWGNPMSRGCVNMTNEDAEWLFQWAYPQWDGSNGWFKPTAENATLVIVHP